MEEVLSPGVWPQVDPTASSWSLCCNSRTSLCSCRDSAPKVRGHFVQLGDGSDRSDGSDGVMGVMGVVGVMRVVGVVG